MKQTVFSFIEYPPAQCRYRGFRNGPGEENQYENSDVWMHVFTARLVFIVVFEVSRKYPMRG